MKKITIPHFKYEDEFRQKGYSFVAGIDEVGRGCFAGPVMAGAVVLKEPIDGVRDSKLLQVGDREMMAREIKSAAVSFAVGSATVEEIDNLGIQKAIYLAYTRAIEQLKQTDFLLIDGHSWKETPLPSLSIIKGDNISQSIAAASIIAKVERDQYMRKLHEVCPNYGFDKHKGYGTKLHQECLMKYGPCEHHRRSFRPIRQLLQDL